MLPQPQAPLLLLRELPMSKVAELVGETDTRLWRMRFRQVDAAYAQADFSNGCCVSVFADLVKKRVRFATEGKDHGVWVKFIEALEQHNGHRHAVTPVSMDTHFIAMLYFTVGKLRLPQF